jgi:GDP-L-fucose synthase
MFARNASRVSPPAGLCDDTASAGQAQRFTRSAGLKGVWHTQAKGAINMAQGSRVYVAGHAGLVGSAICRALARAGYANVVTRGLDALDLRDQAATSAFVAAERPDVVIIAAARVGGIMANWELPYEFIAENLAIELNLIEAAFRNGCRRLIFLGSSCIYPREAPQPLREDYLLTGPLEETNRAYAVAKIAGIELCRSLNREYGTDYLSVMPTNLYGPGDNFDLNTSHVLPAMIRKFHEAKSTGDGHADGAVNLWGTGAPRREFLFVDDLAEAIVFLLENVPATAVPDALVNIGCGRDGTIRELAELVQRVVGHRGAIAWDTTKPDGTPQKLLDVSRLNDLGWQAKTGLEEGIRSTYDWYRASR